MNDCTSSKGNGSRWSRFLLPLLLSLVVHVAAFAQGTEIRGTVVDDTGEPVIGATVMIDGTKIGTATDIDGNFTLKCEPGKKLTVSYIGFETQTVKAENGMTIQLKNSGISLNDVEVVAYGVQKKVTVTGALSSIKGEDLTRTPVTNVNNILAGQMSGVTTVQYSGEPGSDAATVFVRGQGTWSDSAPLIQVDGVERSMADIDPEDIENITVLKDASATAVFGVRGANGVVLITTKRGKEGAPKIDISTNFSILQASDMVEMADSYEYGTFTNMKQRNDWLANGGTLETFTPQFSDEILQKFKDQSDPIRFPSMRWDKYALKKSTLQTKTNVNISGGTKTVRYFVSAGLLTQGGLFNEFGRDFHFGYGYNKFNYRANLDLDVTSTTTVSFNIAGLVSNADKPRSGQGSEGVIRGIFQSTPFSSPGIIDGKYIETTTDYTDGLRLPFIGGNGLSYYVQNGGGAISTNINKLQGDLIIRQKLDFITQDLSLLVKGSYNSQFNVLKTLELTTATYNPVLMDDGTIQYRKNGQDALPSYADDTNKARDWYIEAQLNYSRKFGEHTVGALFLYNQSKTYYPKEYTDIPRGYVGLVGRFTYDYANRYMAEFNIGYNGSENFHPSRRFGTFPAGSLGWVVSNENFFEPLRETVDFLKLRASLGLVGNDKIGGSRFMYTADPFQTGSDQMYGKNQGYAYNFGVNNSSAHLGAYELSKNNPDVGWEKALKQDYGVDIYMLNSRLRATFDYYREHRTNILLQDMTAPSYIGFTVPYSNQGIVDSWGWEVSLQWNQSIGSDWRYWVNLNLSHNQNKVKVRKEPPQNNAYQLSEGYRIGSRSQYQFFRFYDAETPALYERTFGQKFPQQIVDLQPGDAVYVDLDGNGIIDPNDMTHALGYTDDPQYIAGLNMGLQWKGLEFSMLWTGAWDVSRMLSDVFRTPFTSRTDVTTGGLLKYHVYNTWNPENPGQDYEYPRATETNGQANNYLTSTLYEKDAKYLRLRTIQLAYTWKAPFMKKIGLRNLQVALSGYNLLTFSPYIWGDPEQRASDSPSYPLQKTYTVSLKLNF